VIRFSAIVSVVAIALGLLVAGAVSGTLMLVYLAIGVASLALLLLVAGVMIWRDVVFGRPAGLDGGRAADVFAAADEPAVVAAGARIAASSAAAQEGLTRPARSPEPAYSGAGRGRADERARRDQPAEPADRVDLSEKN